MTVRLLKPYAQRPAGAIATFGASIEAGMIEAKIASADLTGGIEYFITRPGLRLQVQQIAVGKLTLRAAEQAPALLPEGQVLYVSGAAGALGKVHRLDPEGDSTLLQTWTIGTGALAPIGPYSGQQRFLITCSIGSVDASVGDAALGVPRIVKSVAGLVDSDGVPLPANGPAGVLNFNPARMRKWCAAKARVLSKTGRGIAAVMGDSRTAGFGATGAANFVGARAKNRAAQLAAFLNARGLPAHTDSFFCDGNINSVGATVPQYDPRIAMG
ncbi:hypothetical protein CSQ90_21955, partial [Janthinobacterium sp. BJB303]